MNPDLLTYVAGAGLVAVAGCWFAYQLSISAQLQFYRRETSRFPLFAARDDLIRLVVDGKVEEGEPAWRSAYELVGWLLKLEQKLDPLDFTLKYLRAIYSDWRRGENVEGLREKRAREEAELVARVPEFGAATTAIGAGLSHLLERRKTRLRMLVLWTMLLLLQATAIVVRSGVSSALAFREAASNPSVRTVRMWRDFTNDAIARLRV